MEHRKKLEHRSSDGHGEVGGGGGEEPAGDLAGNVSVAAGKDVLKT
jgi:hypothetical protein